MTPSTSTQRPAVIARSEGMDAHAAFNLAIELVILALFGVGSLLIVWSMVP